MLLTLATAAIAPSSGKNVLELLTVSQRKDNSSNFYLVFIIHELLFNFLSKNLSDH